MLKAEHFSDKYQVRKLTEEDVPQVVELCKEHPFYYQHCPPFVTEESIINDMKALPEGKGMEDKYYLGFFDHNTLIAVMDFIDAYPNKSTAFIGFFMINAAIQNQGVGTQIIQKLSQYLKSQGYEHIRLGWVRGNHQSEAFWHKNGFSETGVTYETSGYTVLVAQHDL